MKTIIIFLILILILHMCNIIPKNSEFFSSINMDEVLKNLDELKLIGDDVYNSYIDEIYDKYFENNYNEKNHYLDGSFPTHGGFKIYRKRKKNYNCPYNARLFT